MLGAYAIALAVGLGALIGLASLVVAGGCLLSAAWGMVQRRRRSEDDPSIAVQVLKISTSLALCIAPFAAKVLAEGSSGWGDDDGDGYLNGFSNGSYTWVDVNGLHLLIWWGVLSGVVMGFAWFVRRGIVEAVTWEWAWRPET